ERTLFILEERRDIRREIDPERFLNLLPAIVPEPHQTAKAASPYRPLAIFEQRENRTFTNSVGERVVANLSVPDVRDAAEITDANPKAAVSTRAQHRDGALGYWWP